MSGAASWAWEWLAAVADHRLALLGGWLSPPAIVLLAPDDLVLDLLVSLWAVVLVLHTAQTTRGTDL